MEYAKLDAALAAAVDRTADTSARDLVVFVSIGSSPDEDGLRLLRRLGAAQVPAPPSLVSVTASADDVRRLSAAPWVRALRLSRHRRLA